ncbi:MAG: hypothetical protein M9924_05660 [Rhizobiaceae bacterium]|nr:hypothetical protein [Rhizobiaceae bacterium]
MLGGEEGCRPHEKGIRVGGAWIKDVLDLEACRVSRDIGLNNCHFEEAPILRAAIINRLFLNGSSFPGLQAERLEVRGGIYLRGARVDGTVVLAQSRLGGNLECDGATIRAQDHAIDAERIEVRSVLVRRARLQGGINLHGAQLAADFDGSGSTISFPEGVAIDFEKSENRGSLTVRGAEVDGEIRLVASLIEGDFDCTDAVLSNPGKSALDMSRTVIKGAFFLHGKARVDGVLAMTGASIDTIHDSSPCWPKAGDLLLNRCLYRAFIDSPVDAGSRLDWLARQDPERWGEDFWPQPYEQLGLVFREMGHIEDSRAVLIVKERRQRRARRARAKNRLWWAILAVQDGILAVTVAYGRQPLLALAWLLLFWAVGVGVFWNADRLGALKPNSAVVLRSPEWTLCGINTSEEQFLIAPQTTMDGRAKPGQTQLSCFRDQFEAASYPQFNPWMYSLDTLLPVLEMGQKEYWRPNPPEPGGAFTIAYFYFQSIVGWALSLLAVAGFSGLVKSP